MHWCITRHTHLPASQYPLLRHLMNLSFYSPCYSGLSQQRTFAITVASRGARTSRGRGQRRRPAVKAREIEETTEPKVGLSLTPMERARPFLLMKVKLDLRQMASDWSDRCSDRLPSETHVTELRKSFAAKVANKAVGDQILCGIPTMEFDTRFPPANRTAIWRATQLSKR